MCDAPLQATTPQKRASLTPSASPCEPQVEGRGKGEITPRKLSFTDESKARIPPPPPQQLSLSPSSSIERTIHARELEHSEDMGEESPAGSLRKLSLRASPLRPVREESFSEFKTSPPSPFQDIFKDATLQLRPRGVTLTHFEPQESKKIDFVFPISRRVSATTPPRASASPTAEQIGSLGTGKRLSITKSRKMSLPSEANRRAALVSATDYSLPAEIKVSSTVPDAVPDLTRRASFIKRVTIEPRRQSISLARKLSLHRPAAGTDEQDAEQGVAHFFASYFDISSGR